MINEIRCTKCNSILDLSSRDKNIRQQVIKLINEWFNGRGTMEQWEWKEIERGLTDD